MISLNAFLAAVQSIVSERPTYRNGGSAKDGTCDCIGLIIGAIRRAGGKWSGTHGSNYTARNVMQSLTTPPPLELGSIVYKARGPDDAGYDLPATYAGHKDRLDYYHVGVVTSVNPLNITHCTSWSGGSGIKVDTAIGKWGYGGRLKGLNYEQAGETMKAWVYADSGSTVRLRKKADKGSVAIANVPVGAEVEVLEQGAEWSNISWATLTGFMQSDFIRYEKPAADNGDTILAPRAKIQGIIDDLQALLRA